MSSPTSIFVYGTLMTDGRQAKLLGNRPRQAATAHGALYDLPAGYPALVPGDTGVVHGELVRFINKRVLHMLDLYEGVPQGLYQRVILDVRCHTEHCRAWTWVMRDADIRDGRRIPNGRWRPLRRR